MGCGKSKHADVASGNTVLQRKKSSVSSSRKGRDIKTEIINNSSEIEDVSSVFAQRENENVEETAKAEEIVSGGTSSEKSQGKKEDLLKEKDQKVNDAAAEKKEPPAGENKEISEGGNEDLLQENEGKVNENDAVAEEKEIPDETKKSEKEKEDLSKQNEQKVNEAAEGNKETLEKSAEEKENQLEKNDQKISSSAAEVKEANGETKAENAPEDVSVKEENPKNMEASTKGTEENAEKVEEKI